MQRAIPTGSLLAWVIEPVIPHIVDHLIKPTRRPLRGEFSYRGRQGAGVPVRGHRDFFGGGRWLGDVLRLGFHNVDFVRARMGRRRYVSIFFYPCSLVPLFFCCPVAVRWLSGCLSGCLSGLFIYDLIFVVILDSYDRSSLSGCPSDHLFGFETGQKPLYRARRHAPRSRQLGARDAQLSALQRHQLAGNVVPSRLPARFRNQPEPRAKARRIAQQKRVLGRVPVQGNEATHPSALHRLQPNSSCLSWRTPQKPHGSRGSAFSTKPSRMGTTRSTAR